MIDPAVVSSLENFKGDLGERFVARVSKEKMGLTPPPAVSGVLEFDPQKPIGKGFWSYNITSPTRVARQLDVVGYANEGGERAYYVMEVKNWDFHDQYAVSHWSTTVRDQVIGRLSVAEEALRSGSAPIADRVSKILWSAGSDHPPKDMLEQFAKHGIIVVTGG